MDQIKQSQLSEPLRTQVLGKCDTVEYRGLSIVRFIIPAQTDVSSIGDKIFVREGSSTVEAKGVKVVSVSKLFRR